MPARNWKHPPQSLQEALEACLNHAQAKHRRSMDHVAADMGQPNKWNLYKWVESGRLPAVLIRPFEVACRTDQVTRYLAHASHHLIIDIPTGRLPTSDDLQIAQAAMHETLGALIGFASGKVKAEEVITTVTTTMEHLAWYRESAARATQPELDLEGGQ